MSDNDLVCNFKKCRKRLTNIAWVSLIFKEYLQPYTQWVLCLTFRLS